MSKLPPIYDVLKKGEEHLAKPAVQEANKKAIEEFKKRNQQPPPNQSSKGGRTLSSKFSRCVKSVRRTVRARKGSNKESAAIAICTKTVLQKRGRTIKRYRKGRLTTQKKLRGGKLVPGSRTVPVIDWKFISETMRNAPDSETGNGFDTLEKTPELKYEEGNEYAEKVLRAVVGDERDDLRTARLELLRLRGATKEHALKAANDFIKLMEEERDDEIEQYKREGNMEGSEDTLEYYNEGIRYTKETVIPQIEEMYSKALPSPPSALPSSA